MQQSPSQRFLLSLLKLRFVPIWTYLLVILVHLYRDLPIYHGELGVDTDIYLHASQVLDFLKGANWFDTSHHRFEPPGINGYSRLSDIPYLLLAYPLSFVVEAKTAVMIAATLVPPLVLLPVYLWLSVWISRPIVGPKWSCLAPIPAVFSGVAIVSFAPSACDHHNLQLLLFAVMLGVCSRTLLEESGRRLAALGGVFALCASVSFALGLEAIPYIAVLLGLIALYSLFTRLKSLAAFWGVITLFFPLFMLGLLVATRLPADYFDQVLYRISWLSVLLASAAAGLSMVLALGSYFRLRLMTQLALLAVASALLVCALLKIEPDLVRGAWIGIDPSVQKIGEDFTLELRSGQKMYSGIGAVVAFIVAVLPLLGFTTQIRQANIRQKWLMICLSVIYLVLFALTWFYAVRVWRFAAIVAVPGILLLVRFLYWRLKAQPFGYRRVIAEIFVILLLGPLSGPIIISVFENAKIFDALFFISPEFKPAYSAANVVSFLAMDKSPKRILVGPYYGPQILLGTEHVIIGSGQQYSSVKGFEINMAFYHATSDEAVARLLHDNEIDYILYAPKEAAFFNAVKTPESLIEVTSESNCIELLREPKAEMINKIQCHITPPFLKDVALPLGGLRLYKVDKGALAGMFDHSGG